MILAKGLEEGGYWFSLIKTFHSRRRFSPAGLAVSGALGNRFKRFPSLFMATGHRAKAPA